MLRLLISDRQLREVAALTGQERAKEHYLWDDVAKQVETVYLDLVGKRPQGSTQLTMKRGSGRAERAA